MKKSLVEKHGLWAAPVVGTALAAVGAPLLAGMGMVEGAFAFGIASMSVSLLGGIIAPLNAELARREQEGKRLRQANARFRELHGRDAGHLALTRELVEELGVDEAVAWAPSREAAWEEVNSLGLLDITGSKAWTWESELAAEVELGLLLDTPTQVMPQVEEPVTPHPDWMIPTKEEEQGFEAWRVACQAANDRARVEQGQAPMQQVELR